LVAGLEHVMSTQDNGGPAFPSTCEWKNDSDMNAHAPNGFVVPPGGVESIHASGMTLRDYFAAKAMAAMVSKSSGQDKTGGAKGVPLVAQYAYEYADAMLKARQA
jgi:hypothetical protein